MRKRSMYTVVAAILFAFPLVAANPSYKWTGNGGDFLWSTAANWENTATQAAEVPAAGSASGSNAVDFDFTDLPANVTLTNDVATKYCIRHMTFGANKGTQRIAPLDAAKGIAQYFTSQPSTMTVPTGTTVDFALNHPKDNDDWYAVVKFTGGGTFRWSAETALWPKQLALVIHDATVVVASAVADFTSVNVLLKSSSSTFELENDLTIGHLAGADVACASAGHVVLNGHALKIASGTMHYNKDWYKNTGDIQSVIEGTGSVTYSGGTSMTNRFAHTFTGTVRLLNADIATAVDAAFAAENPLAIDSNGRLSLGGNQTVAALTGDGVTGGIEIPSGKKLSVTGSASGTKSYRARLSGAGEFEKNGADTLVLSGVNTLSGKTSVKAGTLSVVGSAAAVVAETALYRGYRFEDELVDDAGGAGTPKFSYNNVNIYGTGASGDKNSVHENETNTTYCAGRNGTRGIEMFDGAGASVMYTTTSGQPFALGNGPFTATVWMIPSENMKNKKNRSGANRTWADNNAIFFFGSGANSQLNSFKVYTTAGTNLNFSAGGYYLGNVVDKFPDYGFTYAASDFLDGQWHMVTVTYDGDGTIVGYYDGRPIGSKTLPTGDALNLNGRCHLGWGNYGNLSGKFDDFKILSRCQTAAEIASEFRGAVSEGDDFAALPAPVAKWTFDDPANPGKDTSGNGYDLTAVSGCTATSVEMPGAFGKTLARGSAMTCSTFPAKIPTGAASFTLSVRYLFNADGDNDKKGAVSVPSVVRWGKEDSAKQFFSAVVDYYETYRAFYPALKIQQEKYSTPDQRVTEISLSTSANSPAAWTHVVYTYSTTDGLKIYQDGCERYSGWKPTSVNIQGQDLFIGLRPAYNNGATVPFPGFIDDVRIWDSELTADQIVTLTRGLENGASSSPLSANSTLDIAVGATVKVSGTGVAAKEIVGSGSLNVTSNASFTVGGGTLSTLAGHGQLTTTAPLKIANASAYYGNLILNGAGSVDAPTYGKTVSLPENYAVTLASVESLPLLRTGGKATFPAAGSIDFVTHPTADGDYLVAEAADLTVPASLAAWHLDEAYCAQGHFKMKLYVRDGKIYLRVRKVRGMVLVFR